MLGYPIQKVLLARVPNNNGKGVEGLVVYGEEEDESQQIGNLLGRLNLVKSTLNSVTHEYGS